MNENQRLTLARETLKKLAQWSENLSLVLDALEEAQTVKTEELFKALDDERRRVYEEAKPITSEVVDEGGYVLEVVLIEDLRRICGLEDSDDE